MLASALRAARKNGSTLSKASLLFGSYAACFHSIQHGDEPEDDAQTEQIVALFDNRSRGYSIQGPREVVAFFEQAEQIQQDGTPRRRALARMDSEGVRRRNLIRCRGGSKELHRDYEVKENLGRGGFATVARARDRTTGLMRAVKTVSAGRHDGGTLDWDRMIVEVEALMDLTHPNIVRLHEFYRDDEALYLIEEYCSGGTLEDLLDRHRLDTPSASAILRQMLRGVLCCHAHGLNHRDLKPDNFVFASRSESAALKLIDFGLSQGDALTANQSTYAHLAGTLEHSAPEIFPGRDENGQRTHPVYGPAADVWSLGAIFFRMLTGENLIDLERERTSSAEFARMVKSVVRGEERDLIDDAGAKIRNEAFVASRLALCRKRAPAEACELLEQMLQPDPMQRITAVQALKHRFIADSYQQGDQQGHSVIDGKDLAKLRTFADAPAMRRLAVLVEAHLLGPEDDDAIRQQVLTFRGTDRAGIGVLTAADISLALREHGMEVPDDLSGLCQRVDLGQEGSINLIEFVAATMEPRIFCEPRLCRAAFRVLDADGDGFITQADLEAILTEAPQRREKAAAILQSAPADADGRVDFKRFCEAMVPLPRGTDPSLAARVAEYMAQSFV